MGNMTLKKYLVITAVIALLISAFCVPAAAADFLPGDVNGSGEVLADDARLALRASARLQELDADQQKAADVDQNGEVVASDARQILRYSARLQTEFTVVAARVTFPDAFEKIRTAEDYVNKTDVLTALGGESAALDSETVVGCGGAEGDAILYRFNGARVYTGTDGNDNIFQIDLTDATYATGKGLRVGDSAQSAVDKYGAPNFGDPASPQGQLAYFGGSYNMVVDHQDGVVTGITLVARG